jgi:hypothetical protein
MAFLFALGMSIAMQFRSRQRSCEAVTAFEVSNFRNSNGNPKNLIFIAGNSFESRYNGSPKNSEGVLLNNAANILHCGLEPEIQ